MHYGLRLTGIFLFMVPVNESWPCDDSTGERSESELDWIPEGEEDEDR